MARSITNKAISAFLGDKSFREGNTCVSPSNSSNYLYLHNNIIAIRDLSKGTVQITNAGWPTNTTKERLNAIPGVSIKQIKGVWFLNGKEWDGTLITID